ncbi:MAG: hypothetical protein GY811_04175 [Myxococcales bacterium]|nr:hypothetical protein [Myxococcales bacterium]
MTDEQSTEVPHSLEFASSDGRLLAEPSPSGYDVFMLEQVSLGQSRFMTPGIAPDPRGVALGRYGLIQLPTLEGVVSWLRLYSAEASLDEILPAMQIMRVRTPLQSRELLLRISATSSYLMDAAARCARLVGGSTFTGTGKHFVKYRDERSPYGYDSPEIQALPAGAHLMAHSEDFTQSYAKEGELSFEKLLFRLSLKREPAATLPSEELAKDLLLVVERGLGDGVIRYLWRNRVQANVGVVRPQGQSTFDALGRATQFLMVRVAELPERILELFVSTPGIDVFRSKGSNVAVQLGYTHVIDLASCGTVFDSARFYLFWGGQADRVDVVAGPLELSAIEHLTHLEIDIEGPDKRSNLVLDKASDPVSVSMRLAPTIKPPTRVMGTLVPPEQAAWVKRLVYLLPPSVLRGHRIAVTDRGVLLVSEAEIDTIPIGNLLVELAAGLLIPAGMELVPRVAPDVLATTLGHGAGVLTIFPPNGSPFQIGEASFVPLERRAIAKLDVEEVTSVSMAYEGMGDPSVANDPVGRFALWGFQSESDK